MICFEEFAGRVVQDFVHQPLQKKFEVRFYVCVDVEMLIRHSLKNLMERLVEGTIRRPSAMTVATTTMMMTNTTTPTTFITSTTRFMTTVDVHT